MYVTGSGDDEFTRFTFPGCFVEAVVVSYDPSSDHPYTVQLLTCKPDGEDLWECRESELRKHIAPAEEAQA